MSDAVTLVSGGSRGLGLGIVRALLDQGHRVGTFARSKTPATDDLTARLGERFLFIEADMTDTDRFATIVRDIEARFGRLTGLVNNAGIVSEGLLVQHGADDIARLFAVNLHGPLMLTRQAIRGMMMNRRGSVVNISSIVSVSGYKGTVAYSATKGGLDAMTRALAREVGGRGIRVNSVAPGYMETDLVSGMNESHLKQIVRRTPLGRPGTVADVVDVVLFLLSDAARFVSGQTIVVDGGLTA